MSAKCLRCGAESAWIQGAATKSEQASRERLVALGEMVKNGTERLGQSVVLMYDEEDGFFISTVDSGTRHYPVKDLNTGKRRSSLAAAIDAAIEWHNKECEKWYRSSLKKIKPVKRLSVPVCPSKAQPQSNGKEGA